MSVTVDSRHRIRLPKLVKPGQEYQPETPRPGLILLRLQQPAEIDERTAVILDTLDKLGPAPEIDYDAL